MKTSLFPALFIALAAPAAAQTYLYDGDLTTAGIQNGAGTWGTDEGTAAHLRWVNEGVYSAWNNSGLATAEFGSTASTTGGLVTLTGEMKLAAMNFNTLGTPFGSAAYSFTGGSLNFGTDGVISIANGASGGGTGGQWITFGSAIKGGNLTIQKSGGSSTGFVRINIANPDLTGTLTLKSASGASSGIYASISNPAFISNVAGVVVEPLSIFNPTGAGTYAMPITFSGVGASNYGAIRVDPSNTIFSGALTLSGNARFHTHINTVNTTLRGGIGETGGSWSFSRTAYAPTTTLLPLTATYTGASTYTGGTYFGRTLSYLSTTESAGTEGGFNILDFSDPAAPENNMLYHGTALGDLHLMGGLTTPTVLHMNGASGEANSQSFASTTAEQSTTVISVVSGFGGSMNAHLGEISRTGNGVLALAGPMNGQMTGTAGGLDQGLIGTWATYRSHDGNAAGWAGLKDGAVGVFSGDLEYQSGTPVSSLPGYGGSSHLQVSATSSGSVVFDSGLTGLASVSMTDTTAARSLDLAAKTLRLATDGGIQMTQNALELSVGSAGDGSMLTAGGSADTGGQITLTNMSTTAPMTVHSSIVNDGAGAVGLVINGTGRVHLAQSSTFTGVVALHSGVLEISDSQALGAAGSTGLTKIMTGAALHLQGDITVTETIQANGHGANLTGAITNLSGTNTLTTAVRAQSTTRFHAEDGTLILAGGLTGQVSAITYVFSGNGHLEIRGPVSSTTAVMNKEGSGTLTLSGSSNATGAITVSNGLLNLDFNHANAPASNILFSGATLSTSVGIVNMNGGGLNASGKADSTNSQSIGTLVLNSGSSRVAASSTGSGSMNLNLGVINRTNGSTLRFDLPDSGTIKTSSGTDNSLLTGTGGTAYATVGLNDWAGTSAISGGLRNIVGLSTLGLYTPSTESTLAGNADISAGIPLTTLTGNTAISSLRFNQPQSTVIGQAATGTVLSTGGVLVTPAVGANASTIQVSSLRAAVGSTDLAIIQNNPDGPLVISSRLLNTVTTGGSTTTTNLTKTGPGTLQFHYGSAYATGDYTGSTRIQNGALQLVKTVSSAISYGLYHSTTFTLGSGASSGRLVLGSDSTGYAVSQFGGLRTEGTGTGNALVGGTASAGTFMHYVSGTFDFRNALIGGPGTYENNLNLSISLGTLQLGPANTYNGKTAMLQNTLEVTRLADRGQPSSLGTGDANSTAHIIDMGTATTSSTNFVVLATLRYIGTADSVTNRPVNISNTDVPTDVISVTAVLENTGTGTVKFTAPFTTAGGNTAPRLLRLSGTNQGANEIVSLANGGAGVISSLEKTGTGTWLLTGASTYSGGTSVAAGTLLLTNPTGSATGSGDVNVLAGAVLGGSGGIIAGADRNITVSGGTLQIGTELPGMAGQSAAVLSLQTSATGSIRFENSSTLLFDLFSGAGQGDSSDLASAADLAYLAGQVQFEEGTTIRVSNPTGMTGWAADDRWRLFDWSGLTEGPVTLEGNVYFDLPALPGGMVWNTEELWTSGVLSVAFVPEPSRALLLLAGALVWLGRRQRRAGPDDQTQPATNAPPAMPLPAVRLSSAGTQRSGKRLAQPLTIRPLHPRPSAQEPGSRTAQSLSPDQAAPQTCPDHGSMLPPRDNRSCGVLTVPG